MENFSLSRFSTPARSPASVSQEATVAVNLLRCLLPSPAVSEGLTGAFVFEAAAGDAGAAGVRLYRSTTRTFLDFNFFVSACISNTTTSVSSSLGRFRLLRWPGIPGHHPSAVVPFLTTSTPGFT
ncbi:unnamed protein product [Cuscuta epithymum]|uniref:Uncharacterized protein n=1 Tax=Cuscuta epithymum TaxID=186058 RepID=A0AAV0DLQ3_9ASTE|nr:unnamed protein product [Cuscuta epithymum]CAH9139889.1 unnamed protein product [Cuscuta epithymum]